MRVFSRVLVATVAVLAPLAAAGGASADPGGGAQVDHFTQCYVDGVGNSVCTTLHSVSTSTQAGASGLVNVTTNNQYGVSVTGACNLEFSERQTYHFVGRPDLYRQFRFATAWQQSDNCSGTIIKCEFRSNYTWASGEVRHDFSRLECVEPGI